jgi:hypothetical protein
MLLPTFSLHRLVWETPAFTDDELVLVQSTKHDSTLFLPKVTSDVKTTHKPVRRMQIPCPKERTNTFSQGDFSTENPLKIAAATLRLRLCPELEQACMVPG